MSLQDYINEQFVGKDRNREQVINDIYKAAKDAWNDKLGYIPMKPMALITVHNPHSSIVESIGFSEPDDLLLDNFGVFLSSIITGADSSKNLVDDSGIVRTLDWVGDNNHDYYASRDIGGTIRSTGSYMQVGRGGVIARSDFTVTDPFVVAPESNVFTTGSGGWISGNQQVVINGLLNNVTTSDVIGECGLFCLWHIQSANTFRFMISHDVAGAAFSSGQNVNVTYTWSIT